MSATLPRDSMSHRQRVLEAMEQVRRTAPALVASMQQARQALAELSRACQKDARFLSLGLRERRCSVTALRGLVNTGISHTPAPLPGSICEQCFDAPAVRLVPAPWGGEMGWCGACKLGDRA